MKFLKALMYAVAGGILFAILFCLVALLPFLHLDQVLASEVGFGVGVLAGLGYGAKRDFQ